MKAKFSTPPASFLAPSDQPSTALPFTIAIDQREKAPFLFLGTLADGNAGKLTVPLRWAHLRTGDYSIAGLENEVCVERKSAEDLYSTLGSGRDRFRAEHERMADMIARGGAALVVIEAGWLELLTAPPARSRLTPKSVHRTALSWQARYGVPWFAAGSRRLGEITTLRFLEVCWRRHGPR